MHLFRVDWNSGKWPTWSLLATEVLFLLLGLDNSTALWRLWCHQIKLWRFSSRTILIVSDGSCYIRENCWHKQYLTSQRKFAYRNEQIVCNLTDMLQFVDPYNKPHALHCCIALLQQARNSRFCRRSFSVLWTNGTSSMRSSTVDSSRTDRFSFHLQAITFFEYKNWHSPLLIFLSSSIFGICFLFLQTVPIA